MKTYGTHQRLSLMALGKASQPAELVHKAPLSPAVLLLRLQAKRLGYRRDPARLPNEPVLVPSPRVEGYLAWERHFLVEGSVVARVAFVLLVVGFFVALATAFWKRSWLGAWR
jgi:hypothetical protein